MWYAGVGRETFPPLGSMMTEKTPDTTRRKPTRRRRLVILCVAGVVLVLAALGYRRFWLSRPVGSGPAGPTVAREPFAEIWTERKVVLLGVGDSITVGLGAAPQRSYFNRLAENPPGKFPEMQGICLSAVLPNLETKNVAVSGSTSIHHLEIVKELPTFDLDTIGLVAMTTGGNDVIHNYGRTPPREGAMYGATPQQAKPWIDAFEKRLGDMLDVLDGKFPGGCHVFLADIYDPTDGVGDADTAGLPGWPDGLAVLGAYNDVIHRVAARRDNVHLVAIHATFLGHGIHCTQFWREHYRADDPHYWYATHLLEDPNARGHDAIRRLFLREMAKVSVRLPGRPVAKTR